MRIPKTFKLLSHDISVVEDSKLKDRDLIGEARYRELQVALAPDIKRYREEVFMHEVVHFILWCMGEDKLRLNEKFVDLFAKLIIQFNKTSKY